MLVNAYLGADNCAMTILATFSGFVGVVVHDEVPVSFAAHAHCFLAPSASLATGVAVQARIGAHISVLTVLAFERARFQILECYSSNS